MSHSQKIQVDLAYVEKLKAWTGLIVPVCRIVVVGGVTASLIFAIRDYLTHDADRISAVAKLIGNLKLDRIALALATAGSIAYGLKERKGKQRAIKEKAKYQRRAEETDPERSTSGLTEEGTTPDEED